MYQLTGLLFMTNYILKTICTTMVKSLRLNTVSLETKSIMLTIFLAQFVNTVILLTLKNFNTVDIFGKGSYFNEIFDGKDTDFSQHWYTTVGVAITMTMLIKAMEPFVEFMKNFSMFTMARCLDRGFTFDTQRTKQGSIKNYIDLHSGPEFALNNRYSAILLHISVTAFFGGSLPMMYPIGVLSFSVMLIMEKLNLAFFYREPPMYDESITKSSNYVIKIVLYLGLFLTSW